jgi:hypothetical protein
MENAAHIDIVEINNRKISHPKNNSGVIVFNNVIICSDGFNARSVFARYLNIRSCSPTFNIPPSLFELFQKCI